VTAFEIYPSEGAYTSFPITPSDVKSTPKWNLPGRGSAKVDVIVSLALIGQMNFSEREDDADISNWQKKTNEKKQMRMARINLAKTGNKWKVKASNICQILCRRKNTHLCRIAKRIAIILISRAAAQDVLWRTVNFRLISIE